MHHIYLYTPIQNNSQFYAHLTEHCAGYAENERAFFVFGNNVIGTSTYYTYFVFDKISKENLNYFIDKICTPVKKEVIKYEYKVIKKELKEYDFNLDLIDKIGKKLYSKSFNYNKTLKLDYETLENYHGKYYKKNNIIILEEDTIYSDKMLNVDKFNIKKFFEINIKNDIEFAYIFDHSIENLFIINLLSD
ncbi:hypothetical protein KAZ01_01470, partial [Candidatus Gracilibacteria bacterium]|nr:hypothetical protein [Candidatus Gracilibacteria bacterium]